MKRYKVHATLEGPLAQKQNRQSDRSETLSYVPGTTFRGALATSYLQIHGSADDRFRRLFLDDSQCRYGPLDPAPAVYPLTAAHCKRHQLNHPISDQLVYRMVQHFLGGQAPPQVHDRYRYCGVNGCGADMKPHSGFRFEPPTPSHRERLNTHVSAHVGIDRATATAANGMFYTLESLAPRSHEAGPHMFGWIDASNEAKSEIDRLLDEEGGIVYLGHHRTRGYGRVKLELYPHNRGENRDEHAWTEWSDSVIGLLQNIMQEARTRPLSLNAETDFVFSLSFPTGAVLLDRLLRYTNDPSSNVDWLPGLPNPARLFPMEQRPVTKIGDGDIRCLSALTRTQLLRGWNAAHGLPKQDEWAVGRGAVYVYWFRGTSTSRDEVISRVRHLSLDGIGLRRNEGFGTVTVSDPFHIQLLERA